MYYLTSEDKILKKKLFGTEKLYNKHALLFLQFIIMLI